MFRCPRCGTVSDHPTDEAEGYCGACHDFTRVARAVADERPAVLAGLQALEEQLADDLIVFGGCFVNFQADGTVVRQDPADVIIQSRARPDPGRAP